MTSDDLPHAKGSINPQGAIGSLCDDFASSLPLPISSPFFPFCLCHQLVSGTQWWIHKRVGVLLGLCTMLVIVYVMSGLLDS